MSGKHSAMSEITDRLRPLVNVEVPLLERADVLAKRVRDRLSQFVPVDDHLHPRGGRHQNHILGGLPVNVSVHDDDLSASRIHDLLNDEKQHYALVGGGMEVAPVNGHKVHDSSPSVVTGIPTVGAVLADNGEAPGGGREHSRPQTTNVRPPGL